MRGTSRNIAIFLALCALAFAARTAQARGTPSAVGAAAAKMTRGAQIRLSRMKQKISLRTRGALQQKSRRQLRLGKKQMMRAMSRREVGLHGSEAERTRARFARNIDDPADHGPDPNSHKTDHKTPDVTPDYLEESSGAKRGKKMRDRARKANTPPKKKIPKRRRGDD